MSRRASWWVAVCLAGSAVLVAAGRAAGTPAVVHDSRGHPLSASAYHGIVPGFTQHYVAPGKGWEPAATFSKSGRAFYAGIPANGRVLPLLYPGDIYSSADGGSTWHSATPSIAGVPAPDIGWLDTWMAADLESGAVYEVNLEPNADVNCLSFFVTRNDGATWRPNHVCDVLGIAEDYPIVFAGSGSGGLGLPTDAPPVFVCYNGFAFDPRSPYLEQLNTRCQRSDDGGLIFKPIGAPFEEIPGCQIWKGGASYYEGLGARHGEFDAVYMAGTVCDVVYVSVSKDYGLSWELVTVNTRDGVSADDGGVSIAEDGAGNLYVAWLARDGLPRVAVSRDRGSTWSAAVRYAAPGVTWAKLSSVLAGSRGHVAVTYVGSDIAGGLHATRSARASSRWNAYVTMTLDAVSAHPVFASTTANPRNDPLRVGDCTSRCEPTPESPVLTIPRDWLGMGDKLVAAMNPITGAVLMPLVDLCLEACAKGDREAPPAGRAAVIVQTSGTSLFGQRIT